MYKPMQTRMTCYLHNNKVYTFEQVKEFILEKGFIIKYVDLLMLEITGNMFNNKSTNIKINNIDYRFYVVRVRFHKPKFNVESSNNLLNDVHNL